MEITIKVTKLSDAKKIIDYMSGVDKAPLKKAAAEEPTPAPPKLDPDLKDKLAKLTTQICDKDPTPLKALLNKYNVTKVSDVPESKWPELIFFMEGML